jgi:uncharacterized protein YndB with AHSA1/START domain
MSASITLAREFSAAPARVFPAWTNPEAILKWWGMPGFTNLEAIFEAKAPAGVGLSPPGTRMARW